MLVEIFLFLKVEVFKYLKIKIKESYEEVYSSY